MKLEQFFASHPIFTVEDLIDFYRQHGKSLNLSTLHNSLAYHLKQGHLFHIRRGLYYSIPRGTTPDEWPIDAFLVASKMTQDAVLGYRTALDLHGKLHSITSEFIYLTKVRTMKPFLFQDVMYKAVSVPSALIRAKREDFGVESINRLGQNILVTTLERTLVDVLDRPNLCGSWEEIWRCLENIEYLDMEQVISYALLLGNAITNAKLGFFLEAHRDQLMIPEGYIEQLQKHRPTSPKYFESHQKCPQKMISRWNLIVPLSLINREWEEPHANI